MERPSGVSTFVPPSCLDEQTVLDFVAGVLPPDKVLAVEKHLGGCERCSELVGTAARNADLDISQATLEGHAPGPKPGADEGAFEDRGRPLFEPGTMLDETYKILRFVGRGAMGDVYEVDHARLAGRYAAKVLSLNLAHNPQAFSRFRREALLASGLSHPNIVNVIDFRHLPDGRPYLVMEFLEGDDLAHVLSGGALPLPRAMHLIRQMVSALAALHGSKIVHRDLKPQNIFVLEGNDGEPERVKLVDFGLAKRANPSMVVTQARALLGTPQYMAPEQALGNADALGPEADQFSLGTIVYEVLSGNPAFSGDALSAVLYRIVHEPPPSLAKAAPHLPGHVVAAVERALSKEAKDRFPSVKAFLAALESPAAAGASARAAASPGARARRSLAWVAAGLLIGGGALALHELTKRPTITARAAPTPPPAIVVPPNPPPTAPDLPAATGAIVAPPAPRVPTEAVKLPPEPAAPAPLAGKKPVKPGKPHKPSTPPTPATTTQEATPPAPPVVVPEKKPAPDPKLIEEL